MKKILLLVLLLASKTVQAQKADTTLLGVYSTGTRFAVTRADMGQQLPTELIGEMVIAFDTVRVTTTVSDTNRTRQKHSYEHRCNYVSDLQQNPSLFKDKIVLMDMNKDCDVSQTLLFVQRSGAKAFVFVHNGNSNGNIKLPKLGAYKDSLRIPIFTVGKEKGEQISALLPSIVGIKTKGSTAQNLLNRLTLNLDAQADGNKSRLTWVNNTGYLNDFFILQKLNPTTGIFEDILTMNTRLTEGFEYYTNYDNTPSVGDNTYRIKLIFSDGTERYSEPKTVKFYATDNITLYPNPADDLLNIAFKGYIGQSIDLTITDMQGKTLITQHIDKLQTEVQTLVIADKMGAGQYMIRVQSFGKRDVTKVFTVGK